MSTADERKGATARLTSSARADGPQAVERKKTISSLPRREKGKKDVPTMSVRPGELETMRATSMATSGRPSKR